VQEATACVEDILARGKLPIICGGTGLYIDGLIRGTDYQPAGTDNGIREQLEGEWEAAGAEAMMERLAAVDPESAARLHLSDKRRILRALEVYLETGKTITAHNEETKQIPPRYEAIWIGLRFADREDMKALIDLRVDKMVDEGLLEEIEQLLSGGLSRESTALQAIGYKEFLGVADGTATVEEAVAEVKLRSRQYAKRQLTWLRRNEAIHWIEWKKERDFERALQLSTEILQSAGVS
jgi:tRNA dimethylallyltransferase